MIDKKHFLVQVTVVFILILTLSLMLAYIFYNFIGVMDGEECLFLAGVVVAAGVCYVYSLVRVYDPLSICLFSTMMVSMIYGGLSFFLADIFETFLVSASFLVISFVGVSVSYYAVNIKKKS